MQARVELRGAAGGIVFCRHKMDNRNAHFLRLSTFLDLVLGDHCAWQVQYLGCFKLTFCFKCNIRKISTKNWLKFGQNISLTCSTFTFRGALNPLVTFEVVGSLFVRVGSLSHCGLYWWCFYESSWDVVWGGYCKNIF